MKIDVAKFKGECRCGKEHRIYVDDIVIERGAIQRLPQIMQDRYGQYKHVAMLCDENTYEAAGKQVKQLLPSCTVLQLASKDLHADEHGVEKAEELLRKHPDIDFLIACGAGTIHDITRFHCYEKKIPFLSIPTAASVDGFVSTVAAMTWHGFKKSFTAVSPIFVLADSAIFAKAPKRLSASGVGDLLGKYTALCDWRIAHVVTGEALCERVIEMEEDALARLQADVKGIAQGKMEAYESLMYGLLLSGIAMQMIGNSRPASGAEHHMSHLWEMAAINDSIDKYHGEKVGVGLCLAIDVYKKAEKIIRSKNYHVHAHRQVENAYICENIKNPVLQKEICQENIPDMLEAIAGSTIKEKENEIVDILAKLPDTSQVVEALQLVGGLTTMKELTLDEAIKQTTLRLSPYVRQRLTFMRLLKFYDFYDAITKG